MMNKLNSIQTVFLSILAGSWCSLTMAETSEYADPSQNCLMEKVQLEKKQDSNPFSLVAYEQNYILPLNYTFSPSPVYQSSTPNNQKIQHTDFKFQFSFKTPIWRDFFGLENALYLAYTQQSFWQAYNDSAFFRANNYQPEAFLENNIHFPLVDGWNLQFLNLGLAHQSNGRGGSFERTWNRVYVDANVAKEQWLISFRIWHMIHDNATSKNNPDIQHYLGHGRLLIAHNFNDQVISLLTYNNIESGFKKGSIQLSYSFPLIKKIRGYVQFFNGFGQSLLEYNHRTAAVGVGISFSDWL